MAGQVFYRKWRPQTLAEVVGQEQVTQTLHNALSSGRVSHAYLFCGPRGTGKTSTGRILAKAVNCLTNGEGEPCNSCDICRAVTDGRALDVIEVDAASNRGIDEIRDLREKVNYTPNQARYKVYIIDEVHMLTKEASNALLKTLEEPPPHIIFILATTEIHKVLPTILSRCQHFDFRRISQADMVSKLASICSAEDINMETEALRLVTRSASGSLRDAENILQQLTTYYGPEVGLHQAQAILGITGDRRVKELVKHIMSNDISAGMATINSVNSDGLDLRQFKRELVEYLRGLLLIKTGSEEAVDLVAEDIAGLKDLAAMSSLSQVLRAVKIFGQLDFGFDNYSTLPMELALVDCFLSSEEEKGSLPRQVESATHQPVKRITPPVASSFPESPIKTEVANVPEPASVEPEPAGMPESAPEAVKSEKASVSEPASADPEMADMPESAPEAAATTTPLEVGDEIEQLKSNWRQVIEGAPEDVRRTPAVAILRSAGVKPVTIENDTIVLAFRYDFHKENMEKPENQRVASKIISSFLGRPCRVRCLYEPESNHLVRAVQRMGAQVIDREEK
ncbi:DNA polymerase III subunit gamma/tau [Chloroflexota bacterium]